MSLDVVVGCGILNIAISKYYNTSITFAAVLSLMIAVWLIYTFDHLMDARKTVNTASAFRHRFHQRYYKHVRLSLLPVLLIGLAVSISLPEIVIRNGIICSLIVACYFLLLKTQSFWIKELFIAACYTLGVFLTPFTLSGGLVNAFQLLLIPQIFCIALANLLIFSFFDYETDKLDGFASMATLTSKLTCKIVALSIILLGLLSSVLFFIEASLTSTREFQVIIFLMNLILLATVLMPKIFRRDLYRVFGDGVFLLPLITLL